MVVERRKALEAQAKEIKEGEEAQLRDQILQFMLENDMQSVHFPDIGRVVRTSKSHYEIFDKDKFACAMLASLVQAGKEGRPLSDGFIAQFRPGREIFESFINTGQSLDACGVTQVDKPELAIRKS